VEALGTFVRDVAAMLLAAGSLLALRFLALALHAGLLIVLASTGLCEDAALLDLLVEAPQGSLEGLVLTDSDFSQLRDHLPLVDIRPHSTAGTRTDGGASRAKNRREQAGRECR
jgi:hypothetical protein